MKIVLKKGNGLYPKSNWVAGTFENRKRVYTFEAKIYQEPSEFGINSGNVSKLLVRDIQTKNIVVSYDRGYDIGDRRKYNCGMIKELIDYLTEYAENNPICFSYEEPNIIH